MRRLRAGGAHLAAVLVIGLVGCTVETNDTAGSPASTANNAVVTESVTVTMSGERPGENPETPTAPTTSPAPPVTGDLDTLVSEIEQRWGAQVQIAVNGSERVASAGNFIPQPAWSTIKVPLAVAALRNDPSLSSVVMSAITVSDNQAAQQLWDSLGGREGAADAVEVVLRESGDTTTQVTAEVTRPGFTAFGQTVWPVEAQASFARHLSSAPGEAEAQVRSAMGQVVPGQAYGIGQLPGAHFKGGWGPEPTGAYLVRQFGFVDSQAIAVAVISADGSYEGGQQILNDAVAQLGI